MGDLISREALYKAWDALDETQDANLLIDAMIKETQVAPAVDAEPVRHGRWIQSKTVPSFHHCSRCRVPQKMVKSCNKYVFIHYCPYCGAKMDAEVEG